MTILNTSVPGLAPLKPISLEDLASKVDDLAHRLEERPHARAVFDQYFACDKDIATSEKARQEAMNIAQQEAILSGNKEFASEDLSNTDLAEVLFRDFAEQKRSALRQLALAHNLVLAEKEDKVTDKTKALQLEIERSAYRTAMSMTRPTVRQLACPTGQCNIGKALAEPEPVLVG